MFSLLNLGKQRAVVRIVMMVMLSIVLLGGCDSIGEKFKTSQSDLGSYPQGSTLNLTKHISLSKIKTSRRVLAARGIKAIEDKRLEDASLAFNQALSLEITNSYLQFLNAYTYHLMLRKGDATKYSLAEEGYKLSIQFDPTNWVAHYYYGLLQLDQRKYPEAQKKFADAAFYKDDDPDLFYHLAYASYYARDPVTAAGALKRLNQLKKDDVRGLRASAVVMASLGRKEESWRYLRKYASLVQNKSQIPYLSRRLEDWQRFYKRYGEIQLTQFGDPSASGDPGAGDPGAGDPGAGGDPGAAPAEGGDQSNAAKDKQDLANKMVIVDVVIIRTEETNTTGRGLNLLNGLQLQFGGSIAGSFTFEDSNVKSHPDTPTSTTTITRSFGIPAITYSLNIANANTSRNEILARPTLVALSGQPSEFFSGTAVTAVAVGGGDSGSTVNIDKEIGVKLNITPTFFPDGRIQLKVFAERTFLTTLSNPPQNFTSRIDTTKTNVNANVIMNLGETLILSGLSEKETERIRDGTPGLQDIPAVQYLFSRKTTSDFQRSVLILVTPRPPAFVHQSEKQKKAAEKDQTADERVLTELQSRYSDWFRPYPNWASVFHHMQQNSLYREFRTGDVTLEKWTSFQSHGDRLKQIIDYLYY
jgi:tetratricopeptide (TPR) repeat protein